MDVTRIRLDAISLLVSAVVVIIAGEFVGWLLDLHTNNLRVVKDTEGKVAKERWAKFEGGGKAVGRLERLLFCFALLVGYPSFIGGWLIIKVAAKWDTWSHVVMLPRLDVEDLDNARFEDRQRFGTWLLSRFLLGLLYNIAIAIIGVWAYVYVRRHGLF